MTDKFSHGYIPFYEKYFKNYKENKNILEIGILQGKSLKYFSDLFCPENSLIRRKNQETNL